ncbi:MAG TPA: transglutaminaseTgpA domain-containing protein [Thermoanaerobaculia bacterium]|nr:transglutaminaseTgpA domain-containing protein [Thermoanaerobaculia bacterium]
MSARKPASNEVPSGLRAAYVLALALPAIAAPFPLFWTDGASPFALALYVAAVVLLWWRARRGDPVRVSDAFLNVIGLSYFLFLAFEIARLHHGLLRSVSHLLLFTAIAKLASLKRPGEARTALLVLFLLTLASASSSTHVASLLYFGAMALLGFRALCRLAVLADFEEAPPKHILRSVPTGGLALTAVAVAALLTVPLFYALPRLRSPFALAPARLEESLSTALTADRVDLETFGAAKRSDRVILSIDVDTPRVLGSVLRLRESVFTVYRSGVWTRAPYGKADLRRPVPPGERLAPAWAPPPRRGAVGQVSIDLNLFTNGFLFLPYGASGLKMERGFPHGYPDGVVQVGGTRRSIRYGATVGSGAPRGIGTSAIDPALVPPEVRDYALRLTGGLSDPTEMYRRIEEELNTHFVYTLDPPPASGDPVVHFLLRSKAGHCEFFASAAALMLTARGVPARLVTGSYGGESGLLSRSIVVRGDNLHAWVEADLDGTGFTVLDPTPAAGLPAATRRVSWLTRLTSLGREIEFFYDRRILGFDSLDQAAVFDAARQTMDSAAGAVSSWKLAWKNVPSSAGGWALAVAAAAVSLLFAADRWRRRRRLSAATKAYLALRRLASRRLGDLSASVPPAEVARRVSETLPTGSEDAEAIVRIYCADAFGGVSPGSLQVRELRERLQRLRRAV